MSYYLSLLTAKFSIPVARSADVVAAVAKQCPEIASDDVQDLFAGYAWPLRKKGDHWVMVEGQDAKRAWQDELFSIVAPFVVEGSSIIARGEDGEMFEWHFHNGEVDDEPAAPPLVGRAQLVVPVAKLKDAFLALEKKLPKLLAKLGDPSSVTVVFDRLGWKTTRAKDGTLEVARKPGEEKELTDRDKKVLKALAPFVTKESFVEGREGSWRITFANGELEER